MQAVSDAHKTFGKAEYFVFVRRENDREYGNCE